MNVACHSLFAVRPAGLVRAMLWLLPVLVGLAMPQVSSAEVTSRIISTWAVDEVPLAMKVSLDGNWFFMLTRANKVLVYSKEGRLLEAIPVAPGFDGIDVSPKGDMLYLLSRQHKKIQTMAISFRAEFDTSEAPFMGPAEAPVVVAVFSDFQ